MTRELTGEEVCRISVLLAEGKSQKSVASITGRSIASVNKVAYGLGYRIKERKKENGKEQEKYLAEETSIKQFLDKNWDWIMPKKKHKKPKARRGLITPFYYPAMWEEEES